MLRKTNANAEQLRQQQGGQNRSLANMPIYTDEESNSNPHLPSFKTKLNKQRNFSSDLLQQALAAKSNLGLCDSTKISDALQSLRSYGSQSQQDSPTKRQIPNPGFRQSYAPSPYLQNPQMQNVNESYNQEFQHDGQEQRFGQRESNFLRGMTQEHSDNLYNSPHPRIEIQQTKNKVSEANSDSFTPFRPLLQLNTVEDEDEFLYGDSTPLPETPQESSRQENPVSSKEGLGSWSDDEITVLEDSSHPSRMSFDSPKKRNSKPTTSIPLKDLSWKSATAWKDENSYNRNANIDSLNSLKKIIDLKEDKRQENPTYLGQQASTGHKIYDKGQSQPASSSESANLDSSRFPPELLTPQERKSKYAAAALLLRKQFNLDNLSMGSSPLRKAFESDVMDNRLQQAKDVIEKAIHSPHKPPQLHQLSISVEQGSNTSSKRVVSMTKSTLQPSKTDPLRIISPLSIPDKREPEVTERRIVRDISEPQEAASKARYLEDENKRQSDKFVKELLERKRRSPDRHRSPNYDTRRRSPSPDYYRGRGRSRSPAGPMYRSRSKPRVSERRRNQSRERSPRRRHQSRGRSPRHRSSERDLKPEPRKRPFSPESSPYGRTDDKRPAKVPTLVAKENQKVSNNEEAKVIKDRGLFPKSISPEVAAQFMADKGDPPKAILKETEASNDPYNVKLLEEYSFFVNDCTEEKSVMLKLDFALKQVWQSNQLNQLVALKQETEGIEKSLNQKVELPKSVMTPYVAPPGLPQTNMYSTPPPTLPLYSQSTPPMVPPYFPQMNPVQTLPAHQAYSQTYSNYNIPPYSPNIPPPYPLPPYSQLYGPAPPTTTSFNYSSPTLHQPSYPTLPQPTPPTLPLPSPTQSSKLPNANLLINSQRCLRSVPVLPDSDGPKIKDSKADIPKSKEALAGTAKGKDMIRGVTKNKDMVDKNVELKFEAGFDEEKVIAVYQKRLEERSLVQKKLKNLSDQSLELKKMKEDFENKSRKVRTGNDKQFIAGFENLQEKSIRELHRYIEEAKRLQREIQELQKMIRPENLSKCELKPKVSGPQKSDVVYEAYDTGKHWCVQCNIKFSSILEMVSHLHTSNHLQLEDPFKAVAGKEPPKVEVKSSNSSLLPVKGLEFVKPLSAYYCSLCEETLLNPLFAEQHLKGHDHAVNYQNFLKENPMYEEKRDLVINASSVAAAKESRMKELAEISKARFMIMQNQKEKQLEKEQKKQDDSERLQKVQSMLKKQHDSESPLKELDEEKSDVLDAPKKVAGIKVTLAGNDKDKAKVDEAVKPKPKQQVIYIGRAPNFKPRVAEKEKKKDVWVKANKKNSLKGSLVKSVEKVSPVESLVKDDKQAKESLAEIKTSVQSKQADEIKKRSILEQEVARAKEHAEKIAATFPKEDIEELVPPTPALRKPRRSRFDVPEKPKPCDEKNKKLTSDKKELASEKKANTDKKKAVCLKIKLPGCQSEKEAMATQKSKNEMEGYPSQKLHQRDSRTVQLEMNEPKTNDPMVRQALKNILYGKKELATDASLSAIKLPDMPPPPPPNVQKSSRKKKLTEEEKDFLLLGINKSDMVPIAVPKRPPSVLVHVQTDISDEVSPTDKKVTPPNLQVPSPNMQVPPPNLQVPPPNLQIPPPNLQVSLPNLQVPPPNLQVPPPNLQVPPPNLQVPPPSIQVPNVHIPPPNLQLPPPSLQIPSPNLQVPPPNLLVSPHNVLLNSSHMLSAPIAQSFTLTRNPIQSNLPVAHNHTEFLAPQSGFSSKVVDMEIDECEWESDIQIGVLQKSNSTTSMVSNNRFDRVTTNTSKPPAFERESNTKTVSEVKQDLIAPLQSVGKEASKKDDDSFGHDSKLSKESFFTFRSKEDKLACKEVLNYVINTILMNYIDKTSEDKLGRDTITKSSGNEEIKLNSEDSSTELLNSPASISSRLSATSCSASTEHITGILFSEPKMSTDTEGFAVKTVTMVKNKSPLSSPNDSHVGASVRNVETSDNQNNALELDFTHLNVGSKNDSSLGKESLPSNSESLMIYDSNSGNLTPMKETSSALSSDISGSDEVDKTINIEGSDQNVISQFDVDPQIKCTVSKEEEKSSPIFLKYGNIDQTVTETNICTVGATPSEPEQKNPNVGENPNDTNINLIVTEDNLCTVGVTISEPEEENTGDTNVGKNQNNTNIDQMVTEENLCTMGAALSGPEQENVPLSKVLKASEVSMNSSLEPKISEDSFKGIDDEDDCRSPLIHSLEHFMDKPIDTSLQETKGCKTETSVLNLENLATSTVSIPESCSSESCNPPDSQSGVASNVLVTSSSLESLCPPVDDKVEWHREKNELGRTSSKNLFPEDLVGDLQQTEPSVTNNEESLVPSKEIVNTEQNRMDVEFSENNIKMEDILGEGYSFDFGASQFPAAPSSIEQNTGIPVTERKIKTESIVEKDDFFVVSTHPKRLSNEQITGVKVKKSPSLTENVENSSHQSMDIELALNSIKTEEEAAKSMDTEFAQRSVETKATAKPSDMESSAQRNIKIEDTAIIDDLFNSVPSVSKIHTSIEQCSGITKKKPVHEVIDLEEEITVKEETVESDIIEKGLDIPKEKQLLEKEDDSEELVIMKIKSKEDKILKSLIFVDLVPSDEEEPNTFPSLAPAKKKVKKRKLKLDKKIVKEEFTTKSSSEHELVILSDDESCSKDATSAAVPCLDKFDLGDSLSNSIAEFPPVLSEVSGNKAVPVPENFCQVIAEFSGTTIEENIQASIKKTAQNLVPLAENKESATLQKGKRTDSDTDEYENEDGKD